MNMKKLMAVAAVAASAMAADASSITINNVQQRWPWNNKVDITYTVTDGQDVANGLYNYIMFTMSTNGAVCTTIDGRHDIGANASNGTHTVTWTPPSGIKCDDCTMSATLYSSDAPSGDDYMIVDLGTGEVTYEGLLASQSASNARYNDDTSGDNGVSIYKTTKLVLRKIPRWAMRSSLPNAASLPSAGYPTGDDDNYPDTNSATNWVTAKDYYISVFPITQRQYYNYTEAMPWGNSVTDCYPARYLSSPVKTMRGSDVPTDEIVPADNKVFLQKLNYMTLNGGRSLTGFDLPTEIMFEIACRAGATTAYFWGSEYSGRTPYMNTASSTYDVGTMAPNAWGLYDMVGNVRNLVLDDSSQTNLADASDPFTPAYDSTATRYWSYRGAPWNSSYVNSDTTRASYRGSFSNKSMYVGLRVAIVMP